MEFSYYLSLGPSSCICLPLFHGGPDKYFISGMKGLLLKFFVALGLWNMVDLSSTLPPHDAHTGRLTLGFSCLFGLCFVCKA